MSTQKAGEPAKKEPMEAREDGFVLMKRMSLPTSRTSRRFTPWTSCPPPEPEMSAPRSTRMGSSWLRRVTYLREAMSK